MWVRWIVCEVDSVGEVDCVGSVCEVDEVNKV